VRQSQAQSGELVALEAHVAKLDQERRELGPDYQDSYATAGRDVKIDWKALSRRPRGLRIPESRQSRPRE
jgi:hypothetical protein